MHQNQMHHTLSFVETGIVQILRYDTWFMYQGFPLMFWYSTNVKSKKEEQPTEIKQIDFLLPQNQRTLSKE